MLAGTQGDGGDDVLTAVGVVEADALLGPARVRAGDAVVALASSGLHSNGYSLVRRVVRGLDLAAVPAGLDRPLGEELLEPTRIYARDCLALTAATEVHAYAHVTGGGLAGNLARVLPPGLDAVVDRATWTPPPVFGLVGALGCETAVIIGHDWGAPIAWNSAMLRPDVFTAVAGLSVPFSPPSEMRPSTASAAD